MLKIYYAVQDTDWRPGETNYLGMYKTYEEAFEVAREIIEGGEEEAVIDTIEMDEEAGKLSISAEVINEDVLDDED